MESIVGKILCDRYRIVQELRQDDFSAVYLAEQLGQNTNAQCEIERLQPQYDYEVVGGASWQKARQKFSAQGNILKNVSQHPQIPQLLAFFECDRLFYLVREHIPGISLEQQLQNSWIDEATAIIWLQEIVEILEFIHKSDIVHLNIQPSSLIQHQDGRKLLTNFAEVKYAVLFDANAAKNLFNPNFAPSPRQHKPDFSADIHALGKTIIYALTGSLAESIKAKSLDIVDSQQPENSNVLKADIRPELASILNKMVGDYPDKCYQSAAEVLAELDFNQNVITFPPAFVNGTAFPPQSSAKTRKRAFFKVSKVVNSQAVSKVFWLLLALPFIVALGIIFIGINKNSSRNFTNYINNDYKFELKYPKSWSQQQIDDPITGEVVVFSSPKESDADLFREEVHIAIEYLSSEPTSLDEYTQTVIQRINQAKNSKVEVHKDFKTTIDHLPARTVIYSRQENGLQLRQMETFTIRNNTVYISIYTAERAKFSKFYDNVQEIINSWKIQ